MKEKLKVLSTMSRDWIEAEWLRLAKNVPGNAGIERVVIRRLRAIGGGRPNWKPADVFPQPDLDLVGKVRAALAELPSLYALENE